MKLRSAFICIICVICGCSAALADATQLKPSFTWSDRRPIAALHIASPEWCSAANPAGWLFDKSIDIATPTDQANLRQRFLVYADGALKVMHELDAQGMIVWNIDGARLGSFLGCPDQAVLLNPEIGGFADEFFARFRAQKFKVGCCIRPVELDLKTGQLSAAQDPYESLLRKAKFARARWKCQLFYVDTNMYAAPGVQPPQYVAILSSAIFERLHKALPDCLFIPEHEKIWGSGEVDPGYYQRTAPYMELRMGETGTPAALRSIVPGAFSVINVTEGDTTGKATVDALVESAKLGDILLINGWWRSDQIGDIIKIRQSAQRN